MSHSTEKNEFATGWPVLAAAMLGLAVGVNAIPYYTAGTFMGPLGHDFGWTRAQLSLGPTLLTLLLAFTAPVIGAIIDRWGERLVITISMLCSALIFGSFSLFNGNIDLYWLGFASVALFGTGAATLAFSRVVSRAFVVHRGAALGIALTGTGLTSMVGPVLVSGLIAEHGWRASYQILGVIIGISVPLILLGLSHGHMQRVAAAARPTEPEPGEDQAFPEVGVGEALRSKAFWRMAIAFPLVGLAAIGMAVHMVPLLTDIGLSATRAGAVAGLVGFSMIVARLTSGLLFDYIFAPRVGAAVIAMSLVGMLLLATGNPTFGWCGAIAVGLCIGVEFDLMAYMTAKYFGVRSFGRIYGVLYGITTVGTAGSSLAYGVWADRAGSYLPALITASLLLALVVVTLWTMPQFPGPQASKTFRRATGLNHKKGRSNDA